MKRDLKFEISPVKAILPVTDKITQTSAAIDLAGYNGAVVMLSAGLVTDGTFTPKIQESDTTTSGDFTDVVAADQLGTFVAIDSTHASNVQTVGYLGVKRYIRVVATVSGSPATGGAIAATVIRGYARDLPA